MLLRGEIFGPPLDEELELRPLHEAEALQDKSLMKESPENEI